MTTSPFPDLALLSDAWAMDVQLGSCLLLPSLLSNLMAHQQPDALHVPAMIGTCHKAPVKEAVGLLY